jgi:hypothetical protein
MREPRLCGSDGVWRAISQCDPISIILAAEGKTIPAPNEDGQYNGRDFLMMYATRLRQEKGF